MGVSEKHQVEGGGLESDGRRWMIAGIAFRSQIRSINTRKQPKEKEIRRNGSGYGHEEVEEEYEEESCTTPTARETRIPERMACPSAPRKRRSAAAAACRLFAGAGGVIEFFNPPDLETVFVRHG